MRNEELMNKKVPNGKCAKQDEISKKRSKAESHDEGSKDGKCVYDVFVKIPNCLYNYTKKQLSFPQSPTRFQDIFSGIQRADAHIFPCFSQGNITGFVTGKLQSQFGFTA